MKTFFLNILIMALCSVSCSSYTRQFDVYSPADHNDVWNILHYASLAASSHNSQPWKVVVYGNDSIFVYPDFSRKLNIVDPHSRELFISLGTFIENLDIAANHFDYKNLIRITTADSSQMDSTYAIIVMHKEEITNANVDISELGLRRVYRSPFDTIRLAGSVVGCLTSDDSTSIHYIPSNSEKGRYITIKTVEAYSQQARNKDAQEELAHWIRFSDHDVKGKKDGLSTGSMEIKGVTGFIVRNFFRPEDSKKKSFVNQGIEKTRKQAENCGGWILVTQTADNPECWIRTGRLIQRINLKCRQLNVGFQPMTQMIEEQAYEQPANETLVSEGFIQFVARVGYVKAYEKPISLRRPVESFAVFK